MMELEQTRDHYGSRPNGPYKSLGHNGNGRPNGSCGGIGCDCRIRGLFADNVAPFKLKLKWMNLVQSLDVGFGSGSATRKPWPASQIWSASVFLLAREILIPEEIIKVNI